MPAFIPLTLRTERLILRPLTVADAEAMFAVFSDPEALRYWSCVPWTELAQAHTWLAETMREYASGNSLRFGVEVAGSGALIGMCTLHALNRANRRCETGYILDRNHWGAGYMAEAMTAVLAHAFGALDLNRLEADIDPANAASAKLLLRMGFRKEGFMRERWIVDGVASDSDYFGLLRSDWLAAQAQ
ncbi:GNAT family N-acetyltransferase [Janthinobacterium sp.]|uniref:GNAT family N-acetyltransferase n=1 Tax=Janthinobacterium sp. TaxID=1871054 RepID=UPI00293D1E0E|nr:GNAT family N-acetyltransferase [Janthinobacterium sp.]